MWERAVWVCWCAVQPGGRPALLQHLQTPPGQRRLWRPPLTLCQYNAVSQATALLLRATGTTGSSQGSARHAGDTGDGFSGHSHLPEGRDPWHCPVQNMGAAEEEQVTPSLGTKQRSGYYVLAVGKWKTGIVGKRDLQKEQFHRSGKADQDLGMLH